MNTDSLPLSQRLRAVRERGAGIIETMVGILIGMIVVAVVYNVLVLAEGYKRSTIGVADAQVTGQLTQYILGRELANGGAALMMGAPDLINCSDWRLRPLPVMVTAGASANQSDQLLVFYSTSPRVVHPVWFSGIVNTPNPLAVDSPNGFKVGDWVIATNRSANCSLANVTGIAPYSGTLGPYPPADENGKVALAYTPASAFNFNADSRVINLGQRMMRIRYLVDWDPTAVPALRGKAQLTSQSVNWQDPGAPLPVVPLAQNIVLMKVQYGVDTDADDLLDCWTSAIAASPCGGVDFSGPTDAAALGGGGAFANAATLPQVRSIKAVRVAIVVRSEHQERQDALSASLVGQTAWLFNCAANDATCQGRIQIDNTVLEDYSRYRIYETVIPLRNSIWNNT